MKGLFLVLGGLWLAASIVSVPRIIVSYRRHEQSQAYYAFQLSAWLLTAVVIAGRFLPQGGTLEIVLLSFEAALIVAALIALWKKTSEAAQRQP